MGEKRLDAAENAGISKQQLAEFLME